MLRWVRRLWNTWTQKFTEPVVEDFDDFIDSIEWEEDSSSGFSLDEPDEHAVTFCLKENQRQVGRFTLLERVGESRAGEAYRATIGERRGFHADVFCLVMSPSTLSEGKEHATTWTQEALQASYLHHANITDFYELGVVQEGDSFLCTQWVDGDALWSVLKRARALGRPLSIGVCLLIAGEVIKAMRYAQNPTRHPPQSFPAPVFEEKELLSSWMFRYGRMFELSKNGWLSMSPITHGDLSPKQILLAKDGRVIVTGFGRSWIKRQDFFEKQHYRYACPTPGYWSPQHHAGQLYPHHDIFSWGVWLWECLTNQPLFLKEKPSHSFRAVCHEVVEPPVLFRQDCPEALSNIVMKALCKEKQGRYAHWRELANDWEQLGLSVASNEALVEELCVLGELVVEEEEEERVSVVDETSTEWEDVDDTLHKEEIARWREASEEILFF
ncbi:MAG TPA: hypothetical protein DCE42_26780 [Myxococcales bacterium]|nr:hypothetical protein [Deltaproteobacteria bacterium]MBU48469.1 hypothetical protein [Deltaproteobacteria bacterium]HAA58397.1 hypothetical protein [Myxococcales bacterium]